ncbi:hypothetical protein IF2G_07559 [Cordyceps javanica]|nr:hypothetical protein IF2G_07559 [Cordyceps javanica]
MKTENVSSSSYLPVCKALKGVSGVLDNTVQRRLYISYMANGGHDRLGTPNRSYRCYYTSTVTAPFPLAYSRHVPVGEQSWLMTGIAIWFPSEAGAMERHRSMGNSSRCSKWTLMGQ